MLASTTDIQAEMHWDARLDDLWRSTEQCFAVQFVKDRATLPLVLQDRSIQWTLVERGGGLVGAVASTRKGEGQRLIGDLLIADTAESLQATLRAVITLADQESRRQDPDHPVRKISMLAVPALQPSLSRLGFRQDAYDFSFAVQILDPSLSRKAFQPDQWVVSALA